MVPRKKIRAYLARLEQQPKDPSSAVKLYHTIHSGYSGFIHGASPHIMDMVGGNPPRFHIHGMAGTPRHEDHRYDLYNPFFRAILSFAIVAKAFGDEELFQSLSAYHLEFDKLSGGMKRKDAPVFPSFYEEWPRLPSTARIERAHSYRARSASREGTWPLYTSSL
jgi:hypothetical protein